MDEKKTDDIQEIQDENLEDATGGARVDAANGIHIICEMNAAEDEGEDAMPPNPFMCPLCRKPIQFCHCHD